MKYVIFEAETRVPTAVIFSDRTMHYRIANCPSIFVGIGYKAVSAGFCYADKDHIVCIGDSESTGLKSRTIDAQIINNQLGFS